MGNRYSIRRRFHLIFPIHTSPRRIALGVSIGLFVAFLPSIGFQMGLALVIAWVLNVSRPAAVASVWVTNPLTMGPTFAFTYIVGRPFWFSTPDVGLQQLSHAIGGTHHPLAFMSVFETFKNIFGLGTGLLMPMLIGGVIVGGLIGGFAYYPTKLIATYYQRARRSRRRTSGRNVDGEHVQRYVMVDGRIEEVTNPAEWRTRSRKAA